MDEVRRAVETTEFSESDPDDLSTKVSSLPKYLQMTVLR